MRNIRGKMSDFLFLPKVIILSFFNFAFFLKKLKNLSAEEIQKLMGVSEEIAKLNYQRFQDFSEKYDLQNSKTAISIFDGEVYNGLAAASLSATNLNYANNNLRILSGLYGMLKPLDLIQAYRLEMGTKFGVNTKNLYQYWSDLVTEEINQELTKQRSNFIINLASTEYVKVIDQKKLNADIININFKDFKNGDYKTIMMYAKKARGLMARHIITKEINNWEELKKFNIEDYKFNAGLSIINQTPKLLTFTRKK